MTVSLPVEYKATYKILVLGDSNVGKTCLVHRYCDDAYYDTYISTVGVDFKQKIIELDGSPIKLQIWDTAGQERFRTLTTAYYRGAMGILLVYDVTNIESFNHLPYWIKTIQENASQNVVTVLAGNKCDAEYQRTVDRTNGEKLAETFDMPFFEISCKNDVNIEAALLTLTRMIRERASQNISVDEPSTQTDPNNITLRNFKFKEPFNEKMKCNYC
ncbi:ras-related protein Rab-13 [Planococcus citri]|uniref:ras-related protein Rab-13 n=1 Tax=Planococcus citri TaxID=170843 RepID=UPI0031F73773